MLIETKEMGFVQVNKKDIISFPKGVYGYEYAKNFVLLGDNSKDKIFMWLQCTDRINPRFAVIDPSVLFKDYSPTINESLTGLIHLKDKNDLRFLVIATVTGNVKDLYFNLKCPIIINSRDNIAAQIILDDVTYPMRYYLVKDREG